MTLRELISSLLEADATMLTTEVKVRVDGIDSPIEEIKTDEDGSLIISADDTE